MPSRYNSSSALDGLEDFPNTTPSTNTTSLKRGLSSSNLSNINTTTTSTFTVQSNNKNTNSEIPDELSITLCTWNVASQEPDRSYLYSYYRKLFINEKEKPDIIVIGFQEIEMNARALLAEQTDASDLWKSTLNECFSDYDCLAMHQLVGLCIVVYVHYRLSKYCSPCLISDKKEGALGKALGNKGAVSVRFRFANKWQFNLINVHLPANTAKLLERNLALNSIISSAVDDPSLIQNSTIVYNQNSSSQFKIGKDDFVFVVGDFNYRIDSHFSFEEVISKIGQNRLAILYKCDQLQKEKQMGRILKGFSEAGPLNFIPTYKCKSYSPHEARHVDFTKIENIFTTKKERIPSWCDRIFYKDNPRVKPLDYRSYVNVATSDHKPVIAKLRVILSDTLIEEKTVQQETNLLSFEEVTPKKPLPPLPKHLIEAKKQKEHTNNILNFDDLLGMNETNSTIQITASETVEEINGLHKTRSSSPLSGTRLISVLGNNDTEQKRKSREISSIKIETTTDNTQNLNTQSGFAALASRHSKTTNIDSNISVTLKSNNSSLMDSRLSSNNNTRPVTMNQLNMDVLKRNTFDIGQLPDQTNNSLKVEDNNPYRKSTSIIESKSNNNNNINNNDNNLDWWLF
ncbi:hypothetical protein ABK040_004416 [Willaertia magna]